jgi:hypothetical protein
MSSNFEKGKEKKIQSTVGRRSNRQVWEKMNQNFAENEEE